LKTEAKDTKLEAAPLLAFEGEMINSRGRTKAGINSSDSEVKKSFAISPSSRTVGSSRGKDSTLRAMNKKKMGKSFRAPEGGERVEEELWLHRKKK